ncbi:hypothetical protein [Nocardia sp. CA-119907]|uniref:hypothetical protein n=1 Tax=Nocardia sp. CA-119907 TaxID=3239973 RepID=UPI003D97A046
MTGGSWKRNAWQPGGSRVEFDPLRTEHEWLTEDGKKFRMVPYHMIDAKAMEQRMPGGGNVRAR